MRVKVKNVKEVRKEKKIMCKKISQFFPNVNEHLADSTSIQSWKLLSPEISSYRTLKIVVA